MITEDKDNIYKPMLSGSGRNVLSFDYLAASALTKSIGGGFGECLVIFPCHPSARKEKRL